MLSLFPPLNCYHTVPAPLSRLQLMSPHISFKLQIPPHPKNENIHIRIDSLNRCHGNITVTLAITALCLTNSHKSFPLYKEDVVALHSPSNNQKLLRVRRDEWPLKRPILPDVWLSHGDITGILQRARYCTCSTPVSFSQGFHQIVEINTSHHHNHNHSHKNQRPLCCCQIALPSDLQSDWVGRGNR